MNELQLRIVAMAKEVRLCEPLLDLMQELQPTVEHASDTLQIIARRLKHAADALQHLYDFVAADGQIDFVREPIGRCGGPLAEAQ